MKAADELRRLAAALGRRAGRVPDAAARASLRRTIARAVPPSFDRPRLFYGHPELPARDRAASGGIVKFQRLAAAYPDEPETFNILYLGSSSPPPDLVALLELAGRRGTRVVWNQDGVAYPGLGWDMERVNAPMRLALHGADHVFFQSEFCRLSADRFLGERDGPAEILYNAVDTALFTPAPEPPGDGPVLVLGGSQYQWYRVEAALRTLALVAREHDGARLLVLGALAWAPVEAAARRALLELAEELQVTARVELAGPFSQADAPALYRRGHLLLHTKYNDPCPGTVIEAMACGLPVVHSASGGVPELVGGEAGIGVAAPLDFERDHPPDPHELAAAVSEVLVRVDAYRAAARTRAVERFDLRPWVERHRQVFTELVSAARDDR